LKIEIRQRGEEYEIRCGDKYLPVAAVYPHTVSIFLSRFLFFDRKRARKYGLIVWKMWKAKSFELPFEVEINVDE